MGVHCLVVRPYANICSIALVVLVLQFLLLSVVSCTSTIIFFCSTILLLFVVCYYLVLLLFLFLHCFELFFSSFGSIGNSPSISEVGSDLHTLYPIRTAFCGTTLGMLLLT